MYRKKWLTVWPLCVAGYSLEWGLIFTKLQPQRLNPIGTG